MSTIAELKTLLVDTLSDQITNGVTVLDREGEPKVISAGAPVLAVAAKVIKDWAAEAAGDAAEDEKIAKLSAYLNARRPNSTAVGNA